MKQVYNSNNELKNLDSTLRNIKSLIILMHDYPDPDSIASALLLSFLLSKRYKIRSRIVYGGAITRAENRTMVRELKIKIIPIKNIDIDKYRNFALVDTQPGFGNNSFPKGIKPLVVIDHHESSLHKTNCSFTDVRPQYGATTTILLEYIKEANLDLTNSLSTAAIYAIRSETQELGRNASNEDINFYLEIYPKANKRILAHINYPKLPKDYFRVLQIALEKAKIFRHIVHVHLQEVSTPEFIAQIADILLQHERVGWAIVTGRYEENLFVSLRCIHSNADAGKVLKKIIGKMDNAGGHSMSAGGRIYINKDLKDAWQRSENLLIHKFLRKIGIKEDVEWRRMIEPIIH